MSETTETPIGAASDIGQAASAAATDKTTDEPSFQGNTRAEKFLQQSLGTQGDVRLPAFLLSLVVLLAVVCVGVRRLMQRRARRRSQRDELPDDSNLR